MMQRGAEERSDLAVFVISVAARVLGVHPQTLRYYERAGLINPSRSKGNIRLYSARDLEQAQQIKRLIGDLGVNLAGVEIILNMRRKMEQMQVEIGEFIAHVREELQRSSQDGWQERLERALVRVPPTPIVKASDKG
jgi:MerR family transcriptional regulator/heat shock protein HspR